MTFRSVIYICIPRQFAAACKAVANLRAKVSTPVSLSNHAQQPQQITSSTERTLVSHLIASKRYPADQIPHNVGEFRQLVPAQVLEYESITSTPEIMHELLFLSLTYFGFFTKHAPRYLEYPWITTTIRHLHRSGPIIDLGAGVSPIPIFLANKKTTVITVDSSTVQRSLDRKDPINEWGFLDYGQINQFISSHNCNFTQMAIKQETVGTIYSVSVIEHMPADVRRDAVATASRLLEKKGNLIATLDLKPGSNELWNMDRGKTVDAEDHGTLDDFVNELRRARMLIRSLEVRRGLPGSWTDIALLVAHKI